MPVVTRSQARAQNRLRNHRQPLAQRPVLIDESTVEKKLREWHVRYYRQQLAQRPVYEPSPVRIDFSNFQHRLASVPFVFPKSIEQKLEEALAEIAELKLKQEILENQFREYKNQRVQI